MTEKFRRPAWVWIFSIGLVAYICLIFTSISGNWMFGLGLGIFFGILALLCLRQ